MLTDSLGNQFRFWDFNAGVPSGASGLFQSVTDPAGTVTQVTSRNSDGTPQEVQRSATDGGTTTTESLQYTYTFGQLTHLVLRRQVNGGAWTTIRQVDYTYYAFMEAHGNYQDLKLVQVKDAAGNVLDTKYMRYYQGSEGGIGYPGGLKYLFGPQSYARLAAAYADPTTATDAQVAPYADLALQYDSLQRVTQVVVQGAGCSSCSGGQGTYTYSYGNFSTFAPGFNNWAFETTETLPDGSQHFVYMNYAGEVMLDVLQDVTNGQQYPTFYKYDNMGRLIWIGMPSAVSGYDASRPDLLNLQGGNYTLLRDNSGLIETFVYPSSTTAGEATPGDVLNLRKQTNLQRGELGTAVPQNSVQYFAHVVSGVKVTPYATMTEYRTSDGMNGETTSYSYTWFTGTVRAQSVQVTLPTVTTAQNGPGTADVEMVYFDRWGRPIWRKDGAGFLHYVAYDMGTGAVSKTITDVDTTRTGDFANLPSGWVTPSGGGLHLITQMEIDGLGRTTKLTEPAGTINYAVYNDPNHEARIYPGWQGTVPTGPTVVVREDRPRSYVETLTMSATPTVSGGRPTGTESVSNLQTLARDYSNNAGQVVRSDAYFNLAGVTYSTAAYIGTQGTNFYTTVYGYDDRGRQDRLQLPTGTIERVVYDGLDRPLSGWVGTNDTPPSGEWSPTNNGSPSNMIKVSEAVYDGGGVGDSNLTQLTLYPGGSAANRVMQFFFDWRDRVVAAKSGVEGSEATTLNRPVVYLDYDKFHYITNAGTSFAVLAIKACE